MKKAYSGLFFHLSDWTIMDVFTLCQHKQKKAHQRAVPNHVMSFNKKQDLIHYSGGELPDTLAFKSSCLLLNDQHLWIQNTETEMCDIFLEMFQYKKHWKSHVTTPLCCG